jgi:hypothetical protein
MQAMTDTTATITTLPLNPTTTEPARRRRRAFVRHDLDVVLPTLAHRVLSAEFASQDGIARAFNVDKATVSRWKRLALGRGLINPQDWQRGLLAAQMREVAA